MRRRSALLALAAIVLHALAPVLASAMPHAAAGQLEICTEHGVVKVDGGAGGPSGEAPPAPGHCSSCTCHGTAAPASSRPGQGLAGAGAAERPPSITARPASLFASDARPRAPPLCS